MFSWHRFWITDMITLHHLSIPTIIIPLRIYQIYPCLTGRNNLSFFTQPTFKNTVEKGLSLPNIKSKHTYAFESTFSRLLYRISQASWANPVINWAVTADYEMKAVAKTLELRKSRHYRDQWMIFTKRGDDRNLKGGKKASKMDN